MKRVYKPKKEEGTLDTAITQLYLLKHALGIDNEEQLKEKINKIRSILLEVKKEIQTSME